MPTMLSVNSPLNLLLRNIIYIFIFSDIDECDPDKSLQRCNQICENTPGSYKCSCEKGFEISRDGYTCEGMKAGCYFNLVAVLTLTYSNFTLWLWQALESEGEGIRAQDHARGRREEGNLNFLSSSRAQIPLSPSPFNACYAG